MAKKFHPVATDNSQSGFALIVVLSFLFLVSLIVTPFILQTRTGFFIAKNSNQLAKLSLLADGAIHITAAALLSGNRRYQANRAEDGRPSLCSIANFEIETHVQNHLGLIDLNAASPRLLKLGFEALGYDTFKADKLVRTVVHFRSAFIQSSGDDIYETNKTKRGDRFASVLELADINVDPPIDYRKINQVFTIQSGATSLEQAWASKILLDQITAFSDKDLPLIEGSAVPLTSGIFTIAVGVEDKNTGLKSKLTRITALNYHTVSPIFYLETIPVPSNEITQSNAKDIGDCASLFGEDVSKLIGSSI